MYDLILTALDVGWWISTVLFLGFLGVLVLVCAETTWHELNKDDDDDANT